MNRSDLQSMDGTARLPALHPAKEESLLPTDQNQAVEANAALVQRMGTNSPQTSPEAFAPLIAASPGFAAMRRLQRSYGNRYVGQTLGRHDPRLD